MELRERLRPWYAVLGEIDFTVTNGDVLTFSLGNHNLSEKKAAFTIEGIQLLSWVGLVSVETLDAVAGDLLRNRGYAPPRSVRSAEILHTGSYGFDAVSTCFLVRSGKRRPSDAYLELCRLIDQALDNGGIGGSDMRRRAKIPVRVCLSGVKSTWMRNLQRIAAFTKQQIDHDHSIGDRWFDLRVTKVTFSAVYNFAIDETRLAHINTLLAHGVMVEDCRAPTLHVAKTAAGPCTFARMQEFFGTTEHVVDNATKRSSGLHNLCLFLDEIDSEMIPRVLSGIGSSHTVRTLRVRIRDSSRCSTQATQWFGLTLFSSLATHTIDDISIDLDSPGMLEGVTQVLEANDPLTVVYECHVDSIQAHQHLRATASRFALFNPAVEEDCAMVDTSTHTELRVISHENDWWSVLLPAWGRAWVHDGDMTLSTAPLPTTINQCHGTVTMKMNRARVNELGSLFECIGPAVKTLQVEVNNGIRYMIARDDDSLGSVSIPRPTHMCELLFIVDGVQHLDELVDEFASSRVLSLLDRLQLQIHCRRSSVPTRFTDALCDRRHPMYKCLEELYVSQTDVCAVSGPLTRVLDDNTRLAKLTMTGPIDADAAVHRSALTAYHGRALAIPLSSRARLAFLSVVLSAGTEPSCMPDLDSSVLAIVFAFAAQRHRRQVFVWAW